jgi:hypothetical protein
VSRRLLVIPIVLIAVLATGSAAAKPSRTTAVGKVAGTEAYLAVTYDGAKLRAYACDGSARRLPTISTWFEAEWDGRGATTVISGGHKLEIERVDDDERIQGELDGHPFVLEPASGPAGLYERTSGTTTDTWVVLATGDIRGAMVSPRPPKRCVRVTLTGPNGPELVWVCS